MAGKEGDVLRKLLAYTAVVVVFISLLAMISVWLDLW